MRAPVVEQRLIEERDIPRRRHQAARWEIRVAHFGVVHLEHDALVDRTHVGARRRHAELLVFLVLGRLAHPFDVGHPRLQRTRQSDTQVGQSERLRDPLAHEFAESFAADPLDRLGDRPIVRVESLQTSCRVLSGTNWTVNGKPISIAPACVRKTPRLRIPNHNRPAAPSQSVFSPGLQSCVRGRGKNALSYNGT